MSLREQENLRPKQAMPNKLTKESPKFMIVLPKSFCYLGSRFKFSCFPSLGQHKQRGIFYLSVKCRQAVLNHAWNHLSALIATQGIRGARLQIAQGISCIKQ